MSRIRANQITNQSADGAPTVQNGLIITGVTTSTSFVGNVSGTTGTFGDFVDVGDSIKLGNAGIITATSFVGNISGTTGTFGDFLNVGSNIQLGNAGVATATTFVGNLTGNVNNTGNLLLQIGGSEKFRVGGSGQLGIGGANYGTSGQVLTSGGSGSAATWSTISGTTINNKADNRVITGSGTANTLNGEGDLTFDGNQLYIDCNNYAYPLVVNSTQSSVRAVIRQTNDANATWFWKM